MDFGLSEDQRAIRDTVRKLARTELASGYLERASRRTSPGTCTDGSPTSACSASSPARTTTRWTGRTSSPPVSRSRSSPMPTSTWPTRSSPSCSMSSLIRRMARRGCASEWLDALVAGETYVSFGLTEPGLGSDAGAICARRRSPTATATSYPGEKTSVTMLAHAEAMIVTAQTVATANVVRRLRRSWSPLDSPASRRSDIPDTGWTDMGRGVLHLDGVRVPPTPSSARRARPSARPQRLRLHPAPARAHRHRLRPGRPSTSPLTTSGTAAPSAPRCRASRASPSRLAEHRTTLEAARLLCYSALWRRTVGSRHTAEAAMTKWYGPLMARPGGQGLPPAARQLRLLRRSSPSSSGSAM